MSGFELTVSIGNDLSEPDRLLLLLLRDTFLKVGLRPLLQTVFIDPAKQDVVEMPLFVIRIHRFEEVVDLLRRYIYSRSFF